MEVAAIAPLMGVGDYLGYRSMTRSNAGESDLLLANAEALAQLNYGILSVFIWKTMDVYLVPLAG